MPCSHRCVIVQRDSFGNLTLVFPADEEAKPEIEATLKFRVVWKKQTFEVSFGAEQKVAKLKEHIQTLTGLLDTLKLHYTVCPVSPAPGIPPAMMKLMYKGLLKDDKTLREAKISNGTKMMVVGSTVDDVLTIQPPPPNELKSKKVEQAGIVSS